MAVAAVDRGTRHPERSRALAIAAVVVLAGVVALISGDTSDLVNYDSRWALIWGRDLTEGALSTYGGGPTPHPLTIALGAVLTPLGEHGAATVLSWLLGYLSLGLLAFMTFRLTRALSTVLAATVASLLVFLNTTILITSAAAYLDVLFAALVITAVALEVERPRRGLAPLAVLALAGLLRPEAWGLAALYWLYAMRGADRRLRLIMLALVAAAPVVWLGMDTLVEGSPTYSFTSTKYVSNQLYGRFSVVENLRHGFTDLRSYLPWPLLLGAVVGIGVLVKRRRWLAAAPAAVLVVTGGFFICLAILGLPTNGRYLLVPAVLLAVGAGVGAGEWLAARDRRPLVAVGLVLAVVAAVYIVRDVTRLGDVRPFVADAARPWADLRKLSDQRKAREALAHCRVVGLPSPVARPFVMYAFDRRSTDLPTYAPGRQVDALLLPRTREATVALSRARFGIEGITKPPAGYHDVAVSTHWTFSSPGGTC